MPVTAADAIVREIQDLLALGVDAVVGVDSDVKPDWSALDGEGVGDYQQTVEYLVPSFQAVSRHTGAGAPVRYRRQVYLLRWDIYTTGSVRAAALLAQIEPIFEDTDPHPMWVAELRNPISPEGRDGAHYRASLLVRATRHSLESN